jgi:TonB-linked SusC/RagA family outer membrane protein
MGVLFTLMGYTVVYAQTTISGTVTDNNGTRLPGVTVIAKGSKKGTQTKQDGSFSLEIASNAKTLVFSSIGFITKEVPLGNQTSFTVSLVAEDRQLQEVVVVGYGTAKKQSLVGSVSTVKGKDIANIAIASVDQLLQGRATGVSVTSTNGRPGNNAYVRIRGTGSINAGSGPLYVLDGVPAGAEIINALNPNDIENISVLKDPSSASIYGSRASNGVILVTTKKGRVNKPQLSYRFQYGFKNKTADNFNMMNAAEKIQWEYGVGKDGVGAFVGAGNRGNSFTQDAMAALVAAGRLPAGTNNLYNLTQDQVELVKQQVVNTYGDNNWQKILLRNAPLSLHEISLNGGSEKIKYFFSVQRYKEEGIGLRSRFTRTTGRVNVEYQATNWFKIGNNLISTYTSDRLLRDRYNAQSPFYAMYAYNPYEPPYINGTYNLTRFASGFPILEAIENNVEDSWNILGVSNIYAEFSLIKNLTLKTNVGLNYNGFERESYIRPGSFLDVVVGDPAAPGSKTDNGNRAFNYVFTNTANYQVKLKEHSIKVLAGTEYTKDKFKSYSVSSKGFPSPNVTTQNAGAANTAYSTGRSDWSLFSFFGSTDYNFANRYFLSGSLRRDGSSRFSDANKYATFWSVGAGWNIAGEKFMQNSSLFRSLKLRGSIGTTGNFNIGNYPYQELYGVSSYADLLATLPSQVRNENLTWEKSYAYNIGFDFDALKGRLTGTIDYYNRKTQDLLLNVPYSQTNGFGNRLENVGELENKGFEFNLSYDVISNKHFVWTLRGNATFNRNRITNLVDGKDIPVTTARLSVGRPYYNYFLVRWGGVDPATGAATYLDKDGKVTTTYSGADAVFIDKKAPDPRYYGTVGTDFTYKQFTLSADFYYSGGNWIYNYMERDRMNVFSNRALNMDTRAFNYWKKAGDVALLPRPTASYNPGSQVTDQWLQKGDFIRMRNLQIAYTMKPEFANRIKLQNLRFYISAQNLFTITKYKGDPEVGLGNGESFNTTPGLGALYSYPQVRTFTAGLELTF